VYRFENDGQPELFCASADWLERNLLRRIEACFPILDPDLAERVKSETLDNYLADNVDAWELQADGSYVRCVPAEDEAAHSAQAALLAELGA
jgi:polyphosphate kinase